MYPASPRHAGILFLGILAVLWLDAARGQPVARQRPKAALLLLLLAAQLLGGAAVVVRELRSELSSTKALGAFLNANPRLAGAILMPEPASVLEALPYYAGNPIYLAREARFGSVARFSTVNTRRSLGLDELLQSARELGGRSGAPILLVIGHRLHADGPSEFVTAYGDRLHAAPGAVTRLRAATRRVADFQAAASDENYEALELVR